MLHIFLCSPAAVARPRPRPTRRPRRSGLLQSNVIIFAIYTFSCCRRCCCLRCCRRGSNKLLSILPFATKAGRSRDQSQFSYDIQAHLFLLLPLLLPLLLLQLQLQLHVGWAQRSCRHLLLLLPLLGSSAKLNHCRLIDNRAKPSCLLQPAAPVAA